VIVSIPIGHYPQGEYEGNPHEAHITDNWTPEALIETFGAPYHGATHDEIAVLVYRKPKIAVYAISKNEEMFVKRFCESSKDADLILIADTGSNDKTVELARDCGALVYEININPWRFDKARDAALALIPGDFDICVSLDLDEVLQPGWRAEIERVWKSDTTRLRYKFDWGQGTIGITLVMSTLFLIPAQPRFGRTLTCYWLYTSPIPPSREGSILTCSKSPSPKTSTARAMASTTPAS
jgi:hypothetical protein